MESIDEILSEDVAEVIEVVETPEAQAERERDEKGRFAAKGEDGASPAPAEDPPFDHAAVKGERERRQRAEQRAKELEDQIQALQNPPAPAPSVFEDEQGWQQHFGSQVVSQAVNQATLNAKLDMSEMMVRQANPDFEDMKEAFLQLAQDNPSLTQQALNDPHPWNKAYQIAKNHKAMQDLGATDVDSLKAKIREELMAEMAANPTMPRAPQTLSNERNVGSRTGPQWSGPKSMEEMLG